MDFDRPPNVVIIAGGAPIDRARLVDLAVGTRVIAADAGVDRALALGLDVDVAVGDFDSISEPSRRRLGEIADEVLIHPVAKDATDLELALDIAVESAPGRAVVAGVEGGRPDHALANLLVAASPRFRELEIELVLGGGRCWIVHDSLVGTLEAGRTLSLLPVHGPATVSVTGVRWPLAQSELSAGTTRGVSNEATGGHVHVQVHDGTVLCMVPREEPEP